MTPITSFGKKQEILSPRWVKDEGKLAFVEPQLCIRGLTYLILTHLPRVLWVPLCRSSNHEWEKLSCVLMFTPRREAEPGNKPVRTRTHVLLLDHAAHAEQTQLTLGALLVWVCIRTNKVMQEKLFFLKWGTKSLFVCLCYCSGVICTMFSYVHLFVFSYISTFFYLLLLITTHCSLSYYFSRPNISFIVPSLCLLFSTVLFSYIQLFVF